MKFLAEKPPHDCGGGPSWTCPACAWEVEASVRQANVPRGTGVILDMKESEFVAKIRDLGFVKYDRFDLYKRGTENVLVNPTRANLYPFGWETFYEVLKRLGVDPVADVVKAIDDSLQFAPKPCRAAMLAARKLLTER